jgi:hypothetical protein
MMTPSLLSASSTLLSPSLISSSKNDFPASPCTEFFFVLSASSPCDAATSTPISPVKKGDIPDALLHLLPRRSHSILDVVSVAALSGSLKHPAPRENLALVLRQQPVPNHGGDASTRTPGKTRPLPSIPILLRDSTAAVPMEHAFTEPGQTPTSSRVEATSVPFTPKPPASPIHTRVLAPLRRPDSSRIFDPVSKVTYSQSGPLPHFAAAVRYRVRRRGRTNVVIPPSRVPPVKDTSGRSSPFPAPIQSDFAPLSIPGSERTPYGYF